MTVTVQTVSGGRDDVGVSVTDHPSKVVFAWEHYKSRRSICFEVKSAIPSLGELIRQIRMYEPHVENATFVVVCGDNRFAVPLKRQGIEFVSYGPF